MELPPGIVRTTIYMLSDPETGRVRYVGKTVSTPSERLRCHVYETKRERNHRTNWVRSLLQVGLRPQVTTLEEVCGPAEDGMAAERRWISYLRAEGCDLTNLTDGGEGAPGHVPSAESRAKMSMARRGQKRSAETCARISAAKRGKKHSPEHRANNRAAKLGHKQSQETINKRRAHGVSPATREKIRASLRGRVCSADTRAKIKAAQTGRARPERGPLSVEHRAKISASNLGKKRSLETRAKLRAAGLGKRIPERFLAKRRGYVHSAEARANMAAAQRKRRARESGAESVA